MVIVAVVLAFASALAFIWSSFRLQEIYYTLIDTFPLELRDPLNSRYAFHTIALSPPTPLALQADYVKTQAGLCFAVLGVSLTCLLLEQFIAGLILLAMFFLFGIFTIISLMTYKANCNRRAAGEDRQQP